MTNEVQQSRYDQVIRRVAGIIGPGSKVSEVLTELFPVLDVENVPSELLILGGTRIAFGGADNNPGAGNRSVIQVFNPVDSNYILTVTGFLASGQAATTYSFGVGTVALPTALSTEVFADTRVGGLRPVGQIRIRATAVGPLTAGFVRFSGTVGHRITFPNDICVLGPGSGFEIGPGAVAQQSQATFFWRERPALESELNLPA